MILSYFSKCFTEKTANADIDSLFQGILLPRPPYWCPYYSDHNSLGRNALIDIPSSLSQAHRRLVSHALISGIIISQLPVSPADHAEAPGFLFVLYNMTLKQFAHFWNILGFFWLSSRYLTLIAQCADAWQELNGHEIYE